MLEQEPSRTAFNAASHRAAHQMLEQGRFFSDPLAVRILGVDPEVFRQDPEEHDRRRGIRFFVVARSAIAEGGLKAAVESRSVGQLVILGAGLDTFAYRNPLGRRLKVFEVDHPATQAWKRRRLSEAGIVIPSNVTYAPVDFERDDLSDRLAAAGLDPNVRTFFAWLGVVPYLTADAFALCLSQMAAHPAGAEVVFDYSEPRDRIDPAARADRDERAARVAAAGEPILSRFIPTELHALLREKHFDNIEDLDAPAMLARLLGDAAPARSAAPRAGGHVLLART